jgi:hypothetical protein
MRLRAQVIDFIGLDLIDEATQRGSVRQVPVMETQSCFWLVRI